MFIWFAMSLSAFSIDATTLQIQLEKTNQVGFEMNNTTQSDQVLCLKTTSSALVRVVGPVAPMKRAKGCRLQYRIVATNRPVMIKAY